MTAPYELDDIEFAWAEVSGDQIRWAYYDGLGHIQEEKDCLFDKIGDHNLDMELGIDGFELISEYDFELVIRACYADGTFEDFNITLI